MAVLDSRADLAAESYAANRERMEALVAELRERTMQVATERPSQSVERHAARGKLLARERVERLLDPGSAFLELNALAALDAYDGDAPAAGHRSPASARSQGASA